MIKKQQLLPPELIWQHKTVDSGPNVAASGGGATSIYCQVQVLKDNWALAGMCMHWSAGFLTGFEFSHLPFKKKTDFQNVVLLGS